MSRVTSAHGSHWQEADLRSDRCLRALPDDKPTPLAWDRLRSVAKCWAHRKRTSMPVNTNLVILTPSRKRLRVGDVFVLKPKGHPYYFGRVIRLDAIGLAGEAILIYVYDAKSDDECRIPQLDKRNLLIAPTMINRLPWSRGYFETVANVPLREEEILHPHCFDDGWHHELFPESPIIYRDEYGNRLSGRTEPCGIYGLGSYRTVDDDVSEALGIPLAPD